MIDDNTAHVKGRDTSPEWFARKFEDGTAEIQNKYDYTLIAIQYHKGDALERTITAVNAHAALEARVAWFYEANLKQEQEIINLGQAKDALEARVAALEDAARKATEELQGLSAGSEVSEWVMVNCINPALAALYVALHGGDE